jgi:hypothetical protein
MSETPAAEASDADLAEQQTPVAPDEPAEESPTAGEADQADVSEQARSVEPPDEDYPHEVPDDSPA